VKPGCHEQYSGSSCVLVKEANEEEEVITTVLHPSDYIKQHHKSNSGKRGDQRSALSAEQLLDCALQWVTFLGERYLNCPSLNQSSKRDNKCSCFNVFREQEGDEDEGPGPVVVAVAKYIVYFVLLEPIDKRKEVMGFIRIFELERKYNGGSNNHCIFPLPLRAEEGDTCPPPNFYWVCESAMHLILKKNREYWKSCKVAVCNNRLPIHGLAGKESNAGKKFKEEVTPDLHSFLTGLSDLGEPRATLFIRENVGGNVYN